MTLNRIFINQIILKISRPLIFSTLLFLTSIGCLVTEAYSSEQIGEGTVDIIKQEDNKIVAQGWVGADKPTQQVASISVWLSDKKIYDSQFERYERPDVVKVTNRSDWLRAGWRLRFSLPSDLKTGDYPVKIIAKLDTGKEILLSTNDSSRTIAVDGSTNENKKRVRAIKLIIAFSLTALAVLFFYTQNISNWVKIKTRFNLSQPKLFGAGLIVVFFIFVSLGLTGSSFKIGLLQTPYVKADLINVTGENQGIRSDEWLVLTPLAVAQFNHHPANPVLNTNHGEDGQNMLIVGMTGVPVWHISAIAKPATWGYFLFDLKRALAWNWLFPIFSCLIALWAAIAIMLPGNWKASFLISLLFSSTPYVVAWSNWPAYAVFFPSLIFVCANSILRTENTLKKTLLGALLGVTFAGFVFVLYPPWQVSLAYIFMALTIGVVIRDKLYKNFNLSVACSLIIAVAVATAILAFWWLDARTAIQSMEDTVYPGQRTTVVGGTMSIPTLLRGFTNIITLQKLDSPFSNQSEIASFPYLLLPLAFLFILRAVQKSLTALEISLAVVISFITFFMFIGIPTDIAKYSLWGRVPANRADLALGLASLLLSGLLLTSGVRRTTNENTVKVFSVIVSAIWAYVVYKAIGDLNDTIVSGFSTNLMVALIILVAALGYFLSTGNFKAFVFLSLGLSTSTTLAFNPINIAPHKVLSTFNNNLSVPLENQRVLVLENMTPAMYLVASGVPVANGIFYYPQKSLWARLDPSGKESDTYNRYQHLSYSSDDVISPKHFGLETPRPDVVKVKVDLENFDFALSGANLVVAPASSQAALGKNKGLNFLKNADGWTWFAVKK
jgi:hypothetical protein